MNKKIFYFVLILALSVLELQAQEVYDLNRCITEGLEKNFSILIARNQQKIADNNHTPGNAGLLPTLDVNGRYGGTINTTNQSYFAGGDTSYNNVHNTTSTAAVTLDWTLFQGFHALTTFKKLNELKQVGELNTQMTIEDFIATMAAEYFYYIEQLQLYRNMEYAVSLSRERARIDRERYLLGGASKLQLLQSLVYLNSDSSRYSKQREVLRASQVKINKLMASEELGKIIVPGDSIITINQELIYDSLYAATRESNTSLLLARKNQKISEYDYKIIVSRTYPYLNLSSGYNYNYYDYESGTYKNQDVSGVNYGLTMGINVFDGFNRHRERANARIEMDNLNFEYRQIEQQVNADLLTIYYAYQNNLLLLELEEQNLKTANENLEIALERYKLGSLSGLELREVQQSRLEAEERLLSVRYQTKVAEISLLQISGGIMEYVH